MPNWTSLGHAIRRRIGAPTNHLEAAGRPSMDRKNLTPDEVIRSAEHKNSARKYIGLDVPVSYPTATPGAGTAVPRKNTQAADSSISDAGNRKQVGRLGAQYRITAAMPKGHEPAAGPTMASARTVPSVHGRNTTNFTSGVQDQQ